MGNGDALCLRGKKLERLIYFPRIKGMKQNVNYCCCAKVQT